MAERGKRFEIYVKYKKKIGAKIILLYTRNNRFFFLNASVERVKPRAPPLPDPPGFLVFVRCPLFNPSSNTYFFFFFNLLLFSFFNVERSDETVLY